MILDWVLEIWGSKSRRRRFQNPPLSILFGSQSCSSLVPPSVYVAANGKSDINEKTSLRRCSVGYHQRFRWLVPLPIFGDWFSRFCSSLWSLSVVGFYSFRALFFIGSAPSPSSIDPKRRGEGRRMKGTKQSELATNANEEIRGAASSHCLLGREGPWESAKLSRRRRSQRFSLPPEAMEED